MSLAIELVLNKFDFVKVHSAMTHLNWVWGFDDLKVPTVAEIERAAEDMLEGIVREYVDSGKPDASLCWYSGGLMVTLDVYQPGNPTLGLAFCVSRADSALTLPSN